MQDITARRSLAPLVALDDVAVDIQGHRVLDRIDMQIHAGEHWGIVGANGSGKSTLLRLIEGSLWPAPGRGGRRYDFGDGPQTDAIQARRRVALVGPELQNRYARFDWNFRVRDVVRSGVTRTSIPQRHPGSDEMRRTQETLTRLDLAGLADQRFLTLSHGQQRRVLIARALGFEPALLLLDEPASGLDTEARRMLDLLLASVAESATIVATAHHRAQLPAVAQRVAELEAGRLAAAVPATPADNNRSSPTARLSTHASAGPSTVTGSTVAASTIAASTVAESTDGAFTAAASTTEPLIVLRKASVWFDGTAALREIDWMLCRGEHWLISGANGSGKSTFLRLLHGQLRPAVGGSIEWPGLGNPSNVWDLRRQVGLVSPELLAAYRYPATVRDCIASGIESSFGVTRGLSADEWARVDALLERFELDRLAERLLTSLSYGQLHRTMIGRTLINGPRLVLLDEPWEGLDPATRRLVAGLLADAVATGTQIVCASHIDEGRLPLNRRARITGGRLSRVCAGA